MASPSPNAPSPAQQSVVAAGANFADSPPAASLCGFKVPVPSFHFSLNIPDPLKVPSFPPKLTLSVGINCDASNPLDVSGHLPWGGGRVGTRDPDPDDVDQA